MYENLYKTLRVTTKDGLTASFTGPELIRIARDVMEKQLKAVQKSMAKGSGNAQPLKIPSSKEFTELMQKHPIPGTNKKQTKKNTQWFSRKQRKNNLTYPQCIQISNRKEKNSVTTTQWIDLIARMSLSEGQSQKKQSKKMKQPQENPNGWWIEIGGRLLRINREEDWPLYTSDFGPRDAASQRLQESFSQELRGHGFTRMMHFVNEKYHQHNQDSNIDSIFNRFLGKSSTKALTWGDAEIDEFIKKLMATGIVEKTRDLIVNKAKNGELSAQSSSTILGHLISKVLTGIFPSEETPLAQKLSESLSQGDIFFSGFPEINHAALPNGLKDLEAQSDLKPIKLFVERCMRHVTQTLMARLNEMKQSKDPNTGLTFDQTIYVQQGLCGYIKDQQGNITALLECFQTPHEIRKADEIIHLAVQQSLAIDINNGKHEGLFKPVESYGERDQKQDHGPSYKKFYISLKEYFEQGFKKPSEQTDEEQKRFKEQKRIKGKKLIRQIKSLLRGEIVEDMPDFLPALVSAWFISEPLRNNLSFLTTLMLLELIENDATYEEDDGTGKLVNMYYTLPHLLLHPIEGRKIDANPESSYDNTAGGMLPMSGNGAAKQSEKPLENKRGKGASKPNYVHMKEGHILIHWLNRHLELTTEASHENHEQPEYELEEALKKLEKKIKKTAEEIRRNEEAPEENITELEKHIDEEIKNLNELEAIKNKRSEIKGKLKEAQKKHGKQQIQQLKNQKKYLNIKYAHYLKENMPLLENNKKRLMAKKLLNEKHFIPLFKQRLNISDNMPQNEEKADNYHCFAQGSKQPPLPANDTNPQSEQHVVDIKPPQDDTFAHQADKQALIENHPTPPLEERLSTYKGMTHVPVTGSTGKSNDDQADNNYYNAQEGIQLQLPAHDTTGQKVVDKNAQTESQGKHSTKRPLQVLGAMSLLSSTPSISGSSPSPIAASRLIPTTSPGREITSPTSGRNSAVAAQHKCSR